MRRLLLLALIVLPCVGCDQVTKELARSYLTPGVPIEHLGGALTLVLAENPGAFLSIGSRLPAALRHDLLVYGVAIALAALAAYLLRTRSLPTASLVLGAFVLAGGLGNLLDRLLLHDRVTDFLVLRAGPLHTGIFNLADVLITVSPGALLALRWASGRRARPAAHGRVLPL